MPDLATILAALCPHLVLHDLVLRLPLHGYQGITGVMPWGA